MLEKKNNKRENSDPVDFSNFLERITSMNGNMMKDDDEYSGEESSTDEGSTEDSVDDDDSSDEEESSVEDGSEDYETEESSSSSVDNEEVSVDASVDDNVKSVSSDSSVSAEPVKIIVEEVKEIEIKKEEPLLGLDDLIDDKTLKKMPTTSIKKLDLGTIMLGGDGKTKYIVSLNKSGKKYWKRN
jgi:hypothetical protein